MLTMRGLEIIKATESVIMFKTIEHIETTNNTKSANGVEITIRLEQDNSSNEEKGDWRITQKRVLSD